ncbi:MAG: trigger factor [Proteobacteria bacterium]|nr:trigger factor [Pseudomonadota bacterium]MBU1710340.1 trigger factor [Pseudomonadota bacterium]
MQVTVEDVGSLTKKMKIVLPQDQVTKRLETAYRELGSEVSIPGFRKGKVPRQVLEKGYKQRVQQDLAEKLIQETYFDALAETKLEVVVHPDIRAQSFADDGTFVYEAEVDVRPNIELKNYKGVEIEHPEIIITDEEIDSQIEVMRKDSAPLRTVEDREIQKGDLVVVDFEGYDNGNPMPQVNAENYSIDVGSGRQGKEFEELMIGLKKGDKTSKNIEFSPQFPNPILAGKDVEFRIEIKDIKERVLPEINDEFAKDIDEKFNTVDELRNFLRETTLKTKQEAEEGDISDKVMMKIVENHDFDLPNRVVAQEINHLINEFEANLKRQNLTLESAGIKTEDLTNQYKEAAERRVKGDFILKKVADLEEIKLNDEDISQGFKRIAEQYNMTVDEVKKFFQRREDLLPFMNELLNEKILKFLRNQATITRIAPQSDDKNVQEESAGENQ